MHDADVDGRQLDLTDSGPIPIPRTRPEYSSLPIALAYASSVAHNIEPYEDIRFVLAVFSVMNSLSLLMWPFVYQNISIIKLPLALVRILVG
jgi:hypothetical protein